jgi:hypothetical protein
MESWKQETASTLLAGTRIFIYTTFDNFGFFLVNDGRKQLVKMFSKQ